MLKKNTLESSLISAERFAAAHETGSNVSRNASGTTAFMLNEFVVGCDRFHVFIVESVKTDTDIENLLTPFLLSLGVEYFSEVTRFPVQGRLFIIVKADSTEADSTEADSTEADSTEADSTEADSTEAGSTDPDKGEALSEMQSLLTERELQIAALVALGKVNKQIAKQLHISEWTVATYLRRMFAKLRVDSRAALVYRCAPLIRRFQALGKSVTDR